MKRYSLNKRTNKWVCGGFNGSPVGIAFDTSTSIDKDESMHCHVKGHEHYIVFEGSGVLNVEGKDIRIKKGDVVMIEPGEKHMISKINRKMTYMVLKNIPYREDKKVVE